MTHAKSYEKGNSRKKTHKGRQHVVAQGVFILPIMIEPRSIIVNEKLIIGILDFTVGNPATDVREYGAAHRL